MKYIYKAHNDLPGNILDLEADSKDYPSISITTGRVNAIGTGDRGWVDVTVAADEITENIAIKTICKVNKTVPTLVTIL